MSNQDEESGPGPGQMSTEEWEAQQKAEEAGRQKVRDTLASMGVDVDRREVKTTEEQKGEALDGLEDMSDAQTFELDDEDIEEITGDSKKAEPLNRAGEDSTFAAMRGARHNDDPRKPWERLVMGLGKVVATEEYRDIYEDVFFSDDPLELPIRMKVGKNKQTEVTIICRTLTVYEREIAALAVKKVVESHPMLKAHPDGMVREYAARAELLMMIKKFGDDAWPHLQFAPKEGVLPQDDPAVDTLVTRLHSFFATIPNRKFQLAAKATHIFAVICDILDDGEINGDFTDPADFA